MDWKIITGGALEVGRTLPSQSVHCMVTSPPYWGLRDYGIEGQIGLEKAPEEYVERLVEIFHEYRRVLRDDGTLWLNIGDSYAGGGRGGQSEEKRSKNWQPEYPKMRPSYRRDKAKVPKLYLSGNGLKPKDLVGIPWMVAFALRADGWWLRSAIIWHKPNCMPESVKDRPTNDYEYVFLLTKSQKYFYDQDAIREEYTEPLNRWGGDKLKRDTHKTTEYKEMQKVGTTSAFRVGRPMRPNAQGRNKRTVWTIPTEPSNEPHFAMFPLELPETCILAGTSAKGCCPECGSPSCECGAREPIPCTVLDMFSGMGNTGRAALKHGRNYIGIEINPKYAEKSKARMQGPLFAGQ